MNRANMQKAIAIMERARDANSLLMPYWQSAPRIGDLIAIADTEQKFHACGNRACFAGHIAISPEFHADGGTLDSGGAPVFGGKAGSSAVAHWLGIDRDTCRLLVMGNTDGNDFAHFYGKSWPDVAASDVLAALHSLLSEWDGMTDDQRDAQRWRKLVHHGVILTGVGASHGLGPPTPGDRCQYELYIDRLPPIDPSKNNVL